MALYERGILDTPPEERFDRVTRLARRLFDVDEALVNLIDRERQWTKSTSLGPQGNGNVVPRDESFCTTAILHPEGIVVEDATLDDRFKHNPNVTGTDHVRFYAGWPLAAPGGQRVGTLCLVDSRPRQLSGIDRELLRDLALWVEKELNLDDELGHAAAVQRALLPAARPADARWDIAGDCRSSRDISGDFYDWHRQGDATTIVLADVMGKGTPAAIVAATARAALRAGATVQSAAQTLTNAAHTLAADLAATATFATAFVGYLGRDGNLRYADAGHGHAAILRADGTIEPLRRGGLPIGLALGGDLDPGYADHDDTLSTGDLVLIHSDGLVELPGGPRTTAELLARLRGSGSADEALARIHLILGPTAPADDATAIVAMRAS